MAASARRRRFRAARAARGNIDAAFDSVSKESAARRANRNASGADAGIVGLNGESGGLPKGAGKRFNERDVVIAQVEEKRASTEKRIVRDAEAKRAAWNAELNSLSGKNGESGNTSTLNGDRVSQMFDYNVEDVFTARMKTYTSHVSTAHFEPAETGARALSAPDISASYTQASNVLPGPGKKPAPEYTPAYSAPISRPARDGIEVSVPEEVQAIANEMMAVAPVAPPEAPPASPLETKSSSSSPISAPSGDSADGSSASARSVPSEDVRNDTGSPPGEREGPKWQRPKWDRPKWQRPKWERPRWERPATWEAPASAEEETVETGSESGGPTYVATNWEPQTSRDPPPALKDVSTGTEDREEENPTSPVPKWERPKWERPKWERPKWERPARWDTAAAASERTTEVEARTSETASSDTYRTAPEPARSEGTTEWVRPKWVRPRWDRPRWERPGKWERPSMAEERTSGPVIEMRPEPKWDPPAKWEPPAEWNGSPQWNRPAKWDRSSKSDLSTGHGGASASTKQNGSATNVHIRKGASKELVELIASGRIEYITVTKLRRLLRMNNLNTTGRKSELIERLASFVKSG